jgi:trigger factor
MQVTETLAEGLKRGFTVVVPAAEIESRRSAKLADVGKTLKLPGFRPGKVPLPVLRQRYGSAVNAEVVEQSVNEATQRMLSERGLRPAMQPKVDLVTQDPGTGAARDLEFKVELEVLPEVPLPDFASISLTRQRAEVNPEAVEKALETLAERSRELVEIPAEELGERGAAKGEVLTIDYVGRIDGTEFPGGSGNSVDVNVAGDGFIPGFTEQLEGLRPGETRTIEVTFPEDYGAKELAGKPASFAITAKGLKRAIVPPVDDELAKKLGLDSLDTVKSAITQRFQGEYDQLSRLRVKRQLLDALAERAQFTAPQGMVDQEFNQIWARIEADRKDGKLDEEDKQKDDETLKAEYRAIADRRVRLGLLLAEIGRANSVTVGSDEMARALRAEASRYPGQEQMVLDFFRQNPRAAEGLRGPIFEEKVVDFVLELAQVTDQVVTVEELSKDPPSAA